MAGKVKLSQKQRIMNILNSGRKLTQAQARTYNIMSLSSRVNELRRDHNEPIDSVPYRRRKDHRMIVQYSKH